MRNAIKTLRIRCPQMRWTVARKGFRLIGPNMYIVYRRRSRCPIKHIRTYTRLYCVNVYLYAYVVGFFSTLSHVNLHVHESENKNPILKNKNYCKLYFISNILMYYCFSVFLIKMRAKLIAAKFYATSFRFAICIERQTEQASHS